MNDAPSPFETDPQADTQAEPISVPDAKAAPETDSDAPAEEVHAELLHLRLVEALLFASAEPLGEKELAKHLPEGTDLSALIALLREHYANRGVNLLEVDGKFAFRTARDLSLKLRIEKPVARKMSRAAVETLAIIAYHQPVTRAEMEEIRGVALSKGTLDILFEAGWIKPKGRRKTPGRPVTWVTTEAFLDHFGIEKIEDMPGLEELRAAGLLDVRPAIAAYGSRAHDGGVLEDTDIEEDEAIDVAAELAEVRTVAVAEGEAGEGEAGDTGIQEAGETGENPTQ